MAPAMSTMGQASNRRKLVDQTFEHLKAFGASVRAGAEPSKARLQWLQMHFVSGLLQAAAIGGERDWCNQVYLQALASRDPELRAGIREVMTNVLTAGLEPGRTVFALTADVELSRPEVVGEFVDCDAVAQWLAKRLGVPGHNVRVHYSAMFAPAHAGLFALMPALQSVTAASQAEAAARAKHVTAEEPHAKPHVRTRKVEHEHMRRQTITFMVSVFTDKALDVSRLTSLPAPILELAYWGASSEGPFDVARVRPSQAMHAFEALELLGGFRQQLESASEALQSQRPSRVRTSATTFAPSPRLLVRVGKGADFRFMNGMQVTARWADVDMADVPVYQGSFAAHFIALLDRLDATVEVLEAPAPASAPAAQAPAATAGSQFDDASLDALFAQSAASVSQSES